MLRALRVLAGVALVAYPVLVWLALSGATGVVLSARWLALILLAVIAPIAVVRLRRSRRAGLRGLAAIPLVTFVVLAAAATLDAAGMIFAVPVVINAALLVVFGATLRAGAMPMIERFARLQEPELNADQVAWCRAWTRIWCAFFVVNGATAAALAIFAPITWWTFYTGLLSYALLGALLLTEWVMRRRRFSAPGEDVA